MVSKFLPAYIALVALLCTGTVALAQGTTQYSNRDITLPEISIDSKLPVALIVNFEFPKGKHLNAPAPSKVRAYWAESNQGSAQRLTQTTWKTTIYPDKSSMQELILEMDIYYCTDDPLGNCYNKFFKAIVPVKKATKVQVTEQNNVQLKIPAEAFEARLMKQN